MAGRKIRKKLNSTHGTSIFFGILFFMMANILSTNAEGKDLLVPSKTDTVTIDTLSTKNRISLPLPNTLVNKQIDRLVEYARKYIGTPYRRGSKGPNRFDCSGFTQYIFNHFSSMQVPLLNIYKESLLKTKKSAGEIWYFSKVEIPGGRM